MPTTPRLKKWNNNTFHINLFVLQGFFISLQYK